MALQFKIVLVAFVVASFLPNVIPCWYDTESPYASIWEENKEMCGTYNDNGKIVGGDDVYTTYLWPWLGFMYINKDGSTYICTAELVAWGWVTTAAHCVYDSNGNRVSHNAVTLTFGQASRASSTWSTLQKNVQKIIVPPGYNPAVSKVTNDIALLHLSSPVSYNTRVRPVCMQTPDSNFDSIYDNCWVAGWGRDESGSVTNLLQELPVQVESDIAECKESWGTWLTENHICATRASGTGICHGDSGGPLMCKFGDKQWVLVGVTSFTSINGCATSKPDGFTRVSSYSQWLTDVIDSEGGPDA